MAKSHRTRWKRARAAKKLKRWRIKRAYAMLAELGAGYIRDRLSEPSVISKLFPRMDSSGQLYLP